MISQTPESLCTGTENGIVPKVHLNHWVLIVFATFLNSGCFGAAIILSKRSGINFCTQLHLIMKANFPWISCLGPVTTNYQESHTEVNES